MEKIVKPSLFHDRNVEQKPKSTFKRQNGFIVVLSIILLYITVFYVPIQVERSYAYHVKKLAPLIEKKYMSEGSEYTGYTLYPLYDLNERLRYFLIDFEPHGYAYIALRDTSVIITCESNLIRYRCDSGKSRWHPYTVEKGFDTVIERNGKEIVYTDERWKTDEHGNYIEYTDSHFRVAGIQNEKRYFIFLYFKSYAGEYTGYVPAVKRNGKYINLISMEELDYTPYVLKEYPREHISFSFEW